MANTPNFGWLKLDPSVRAIRNWLNARLDDIDASVHSVNSDVNNAARLIGRPGGQNLRGGTGASESLQLKSTTHATKGTVSLGDASGGSVGVVFAQEERFLGIRKAIPEAPLHIGSVSGGTTPQVIYDVATAPASPPAGSRGYDGNHWVGDSGGVRRNLVLNNDARLSDARTPTAHNHDERYYTKGESDAFLSGTTYEEFVASNLLTTGQETVSRVNNFVATATLSGALRLTYFTSRKTETVGNIRVMTHGTAASGAALCRVGLYSVATNGDLTLVASTANDATMFSAAHTAYTRAFSTSYGIVRGQRYVLGILVVATTAPTIYGLARAVGTEQTVPAIAAALNGQSDLPSSIASGALVGSPGIQYGEILP